MWGAATRGNTKEQMAIACALRFSVLVDRMRMFNTLFSAEAKKIKLTYYTAWRILA